MSRMFVNANKWSKWWPTLSDCRAEQTGRHWAGNRFSISSSVLSIYLFNIKNIHLASQFRTGLIFIFFSYFQILLLFLFHLKTWFITLMPPALSPNMVTLSKDLIPRLLPVDCNDKSRPFLGLPQIWRCSPGPTASQAPGEERLSLYIFTLYQGKPPHQISLIITMRSFTGEHPGRLVVNQIRSMVSFSHQDVT